MSIAIGVTPQEFAPQFIAYLMYMLVLFPLMTMFMIMPMFMVLPMISLSRALTGVFEGLAK